MTMAEKIEAAARALLEQEGVVAPSKVGEVATGSGRFPLAQEPDATYPAEEKEAPSIDLDAVGMADVPAHPLVPTDPDALLALVGMEDGQSAGSYLARAGRVVEIAYQQRRERAAWAELDRDALLARCEAAEAERDALRARCEAAEARIKREEKEKP